MIKYYILCSIYFVFFLGYIDNRANANEPRSTICAYDEGKVLSQSYLDFDQNPHSGWRFLDSKGCRVSAIHIMKAYNKGASSLTYDQHKNILWHIGQLYALDGHREEAIVYFRESKKDGLDVWNDYVDVTIAFMLRNHKDLIRYENKLRHEPMPEAGYYYVRNGKKIELSWPPNLDVAERLDRCFDQSYNIAYDKCTVPTANPIILK
ncbi:hypothetical protein HLH44_09500 [Gluconacetobacter sp. 1c LMG 22058]|uniref:Uncharacterized protein n=1 Tax=Gluconacetobacter dulcium TaxID=2729096 RepID=A0A7W4JZL5_9PROT|nr:hypothetical protein [Gluconacetobacter dulcium]MBB2197690.1 hypothetical protein [Gluconacetobacter dulcium]